jgi:hypothetical protein
MIYKVQIENNFKCFLQNIYPLIDRILDSVHENDKNSHPTDIVGLLECALYEENQVLQVEKGLFHIK